MYNEGYNNENRDNGDDEMSQNGQHNLDIDAGN